MRLKSLDRLRGHPLLSLITSERGLFRALKMRPVRQEAVHSLWSRLFCGPLKMHRVPEKAVLGTEYLFRTVEACFCAPKPSENASRTPGSLFEHGTHIPYHRWPSPVPNANHPTTQPPQHTQHTQHTQHSGTECQTQRQVAAAAEPDVHFSRPRISTAASALFMK